MFIDKVHIVCKAGKGGDGKVAFFFTGKPNGGDGGKGGDVYLVGSHDLLDLSHLKDKQDLAAAQGGTGSSEQKQGADGKDLILKVPLITYAIDTTSRVLATVNDHGEKVLLLRGGSGGLGNYYFRRGQKATLTKFTRGKPGQELKGFLELRLKSDVVFLGFPNAGKSSLLNALTNTNVKVASYPFTTLKPQIGVADDLLLLDLPGLIEGTKQGKGLGTRFTKHVNLTKLIAHVITLESEDIVESYKLMRKEMQEIDENIASKPEIVILTKTDEVDPVKLAKAVKQLEKIAGIKKVVSCSVFDLDSLKELKKTFSELTRQYTPHEDLYENRG